MITHQSTVIVTTALTMATVPAVIGAVITVNMKVLNIKILDHENENQRRTSRLHHLRQLCKVSPSLPSV